jgi:thymidylate synthase
MLAQQCGFEPYEFVHSTVDSHIYEDQIPAVEEYLSREKPDSPRLNLHKAADIESYSIDDFEVVGYDPLPKIEIPVAV